MQITDGVYKAWHCCIVHPFKRDVRIPSHSGVITNKTLATSQILLYLLPILIRELKSCFVFETPSKVPLRQGAYTNCI